MGRPNIFEVSLANMNGKFYSEGFVDGHVTVELVQPMQITGILLKYIGRASVSWCDGIDSSSKTFRAEEIYFDKDLLLCGTRPNEEGSGTMELPYGRHTFPFRFQLPSGLPPSFESNIGKIRYSITAKINQPSKVGYETDKRLFTVLSSLDLNRDPALAERLAGNKQKYLCCLCCKSGPISAQFSIECQGWVPGEAIKLYADIQNNSNQHMERSCVELIMVNKFHAQSKTTTTKKTIAFVSRPSITEFGEDSWTGEQLVVPPLPPSFLAGCSIIDVEYILQLKVEPSGLALNLEVPLTIVIGTIPLISVNPQASAKVPAMSPPGEYGAAQGDWSASAPPVPGYPNTPPPSYKEYLTGLVDDAQSTKEEARPAVVYA